MEKPDHDTAFNELFEQIHDRVPSGVEKFGIPTNVNLQVNLVKAERSGSKVRQIHIGTLANDRVRIENGKALMPERFWKKVRNRLTHLKVENEMQQNLIQKINFYLDKFDQTNI